MQLNHFKKIILFFLFSIFMGGCANVNTVDTLSVDFNKEEFLEELASGELRLECGVSCSYAWGWHGASIRREYDNGDWIGLAYRVKQINHRIDKAYYFLGRSSEELGYYSAANIYYKLAESSPLKCAGLINTCDGIDVSSEVRIRKSETHLKSINSENDINARPSDSVVNLNDKNDILSEYRNKDGEIDFSALPISIIVKHDEFRNIITFESPNAASKFMSDSGGDIVTLRASKSKSSQPQFLIYVRKAYTGRDWRHYNSAWGQQGTKLNTNIITKNVSNCKSNGSCTRYEHLAINISRALLEEYRDNGLRFIISSKFGDDEFFIPQKYIVSFLEKIDMPLNELQYFFR